MNMIDESLNWLALINANQGVPKGRHEILFRLLRTPEIHQEIERLRSELSPNPTAEDIFSMVSHCRDLLLPKYGLDPNWLDMIVDWILLKRVDRACTSECSICEADLGGNTVQCDYEKQTITLAFGDYTDDEWNNLRRLLQKGTRLPNDDKHSENFTIDVLIAHAFASGLSTPKKIRMHAQDYYELLERPIYLNGSFNEDAFSRRVRRFRAKFPPIQADSTCDSPLSYFLQPN